jgi:uncharacterized membrane protein HdeD (DUF308 family)
MNKIDILLVGIPPEMIHNWGWFLVFGIGLMMVGIAAVIRSVKATVISMSFFGWLLLIAAGMETAQAFLVGKWEQGLFLHLLAAVLFGISGALFVTRPVVSAEVVTPLMALFFLMSGLFQLVSSLMIHLPGWGWHALDGIITFVLGVFVLAEWPASALWVIGLFVGIDLAFYGCAWVTLALYLHQM